MVYDHQDNGGKNAIMQLAMIDEHLITDWGKIIPGQNDTFAPVVPRVPGQFSRCPCGVGAYESSGSNCCLENQTNMNNLINEGSIDILDIHEGTIGP